MKKVIILFLTFLVIIVGSCDKDDSFTRVDCEIDQKIQASLNEGKTPITLYKEGISFNWLFGHMYLGGLIFYLDTISGEGLVAASEDQSADAYWGCEMVDIPGSKNCTIYPIPIPDFEDGAKTGDGKVNTDAILSECVPYPITVFLVPAAAKSCRDKGQDWFLPSRNELNLMYINLKKNGCGNFENDEYWTSTEYGKSDAWVQDFERGFQAPLFKGWPCRVRAVREF